MPQGNYLGTLWHNTPCYPTLSVLRRGWLCYTISRRRPVTFESVTMHRRTCYVTGGPAMPQGNLLCHGLVPRGQVPMT